jgi:hypothetical protein
VQPLDVTAAEAVSAPKATLPTPIVTSENEAVRDAPESLELHGKQLAAAFAGMMVSPVSPVWLDRIFG